MRVLSTQIASDHQEEPPSMALYWCARVALALAQQADDLAHYLISKALDAQCDRKVQFLGRLRLPAKVMLI